MAPDGDGLPAALPPLVGPHSAFYWEAVRDRRRVEILRCGRCRRFVHYPKGRCPACWSRDLKPEPVSGEAVVVSWTETHRPTAPQLADIVPFTTAVVELAEQAGLQAVLWYRSADGRRPAIGDAVRLEVIDTTAGPLPVAVPADQAAE